MSITMEKDTINVGNMQALIFYWGGKWSVTLHEPSNLEDLARVDMIETKVKARAVALDLIDWYVENIKNEKD